MTNLSKIQNHNNLSNFDHAINESLDLRLPLSFKKLDQNYIDHEFCKINMQLEPSFTMNDCTMTPTIAYKAQLHVVYGTMPKHRDIVIAQINDSIFCRRIFISKHKNWLYGDNIDCEFIDLSKHDNVTILGIVKSHQTIHDNTAMNPYKKAG